jgi:hypothetical protein
MAGGLHQRQVDQTLNNQTSLISSPLLDLFRDQLDASMTRLLRVVQQHRYLGRCLNVDILLHSTMAITAFLRSPPPPQLRAVWDLSHLTLRPAPATLQPSLTWPSPGPGPDPGPCLLPL